MPAKKRTAIRTLFLFGLLLSQVGCVALNIPSQRFHDSTDHGGLLGHWGSGPGHPVHMGVSDETAAFTSGDAHCSRGICIDGGPLEVDPFDPTLDMNGNPKQPEIPWPRFHPVPSRPVFGNASQ